MLLLFFFVTSYSFAIEVVMKTLLRFFVIFFAAIWFLKKVSLFLFGSKKRPSFSYSGPINKQFYKQPQSSSPSSDIETEGRVVKEY
jgi:hypothetical protein